MTVSFCFHYELNDFLPEDRRETVFPFHFERKQTVRDLIEALGIPHSAIGQIQLNGLYVDKGTHATDHDSIHVFPNREIPRHIAFVADTHMGKLARLLRMLGFDVDYRNQFNDDEIAAVSDAEERIVLTRDVGLLKRNLVTHGHWVRSQDPEEQLREVVQRYDLSNKTNEFTRCMTCNGMLGPIAKANIEHQLEPMIQRDYHEFWQCNKCSNVYWKGSHYDRMVELIRSMEER